MRQRKPGQPRGHRELVAPLAVAGAAAIVAVAVPLLAVRQERGTASEIIPPLPVLLVLSAVSIGIALVALYRLAADRAGTGAAGRQALEQTDARPLETDRSRRAGGSKGSAESDSRVTRAVPEAPALPAPAVDRDRHPVPDEVAAVPDSRIDAAARGPDAERATAKDRRPVVRAPRRLQRQRGRTGTDERASARARDDEGRAPVGTAGLPDEDATATETCELVWWHGANKGGFEARTNGPDRRPRVVGRSRTISWRERTPPPPEGAAADAHRLLVEKLELEGWLESNGGAAWYSARFARSSNRHLHGSSPTNANSGDASALDVGRTDALRRVESRGDRRRSRTSPP